MKSNKIFIFLIIALIVSYAKSQTLDQAEKDAAIELLLELKGISPSDPCSVGYFSCSDPDANNIIHINTINLEYYGEKGNDITIKTDLTVFKRLTALNIVGNGIRVSGSFFNNFYKLQFLREIFLDTVTDSIDGVKVPIALYSIDINTFGSKVPQSFFTIPLLKITRAIKGYAMVNVINECVDMNRFDSSVRLTLPISSMGGLPKNFFNCYFNIGELLLYVQNVKSVDSKPFSFPKFPATVINSLNIYFDYQESPDIYTFVFEPTIKNIINLNTLKISYPGFEIDSSLNYFEVNTQSIEFQNLDDQFLYNCKSNRCFRNLYKGNDASWYSDSCDFYLQYLDLSNFGSVYIRGNNIEQTLPTEYNFTGSLNIQYSTIIGSIPESFCTARALTFSSVAFDGDVASCIVCQGGSYFGEDLLDFGSISFTNFDMSTPASCPYFSITPIENVVISTNGGSVVFEGHDLGYYYYEQLEIGEDDSFEILPVPNEKVSLRFPAGEGIDVAKTFYFHVPQFYDDFTFTVTYSYEKPAILAYRPSNDYITFLGTGFRYTGSNTFTINDNQVELSTAANNQTTTVSSVELYDDDQFTVVAIMNDQNSDQVTFTFTSQVMSISKDIIALNDIGGTISIPGEFYQSDASKLIVLIDNKKCSVSSVNSTSITINYPSYTVGSHELFIIDTQTNTFDYSDNLVYQQYIAPLPPYVPPSNSHGSAGSNSDSNSDNVNDSNVLYLSFNLILSISILILLL